MKFKLLAFAFIAIMGVSCGKSQKVSDPVVRPVNVYTAETFGWVNRDFSGVVVAEKYTNLAFTVSGQILKLNVDEGKRVQKGDIIAELDPRDYQLKVDVAKAELQTSEQQMIRSSRLFEKQAVSKQDYEIAQTNFVRAQASYDNARYMLNDTKLKAPFSGIIESKFVENFQTASVGQSIVKLVDPKILNIQFILPENSIDVLTNQTNEFTVEFDNYKGQFFKAKLKEYVEASADGAGVPVTLVINDPNFTAQKYNNVNPGFSCLVKLKVENPGYENVCMVPLTAVLNNPIDNKNYVWVVTDSKVSVREVKLGQLFGEKMVIVETGIKPGETVVTGGVYQIVDGQQVRIIK